MRVTALIAALVVALAGCSKKEPKPLRTEPWLAHPPASAAAASSDGGAVQRVRYALDERSVLRVEVSADRLELSGTIATLSGEAELDPSDPGSARGRVRAELASLRLGNGGGDSEATALALRALDALDRDAGSTSASFELTALEDPSPAVLEPIPEHTPLPFKRKLRATLVGNLLLHGFRVERRIPVQAEFEYAADRSIPSGLSIWTAKPFVIALETHAIAALDRSGKPARRASARANIEFHYRKID